MQPINFGTWMRATRRAKELTQTECAKAAGMKVQQWNRTEKTVRRPERATVEVIAIGLRVPVAEALIAADYPSEHDTGLSSWEILMAHKLSRVPHEKQNQVERALDSLLTLAGSA